MENDLFFVVGNAVQVSAMAGVYAMTLTVANDRAMGTLGPLMTTPAGRSVVFVGRALPVVINGLVVAGFSLATATVLLRPGVGIETLLPLGLVILVTAASITGLGILIGSVGLWARDIWFVANLAYFLLLLFCGVNVPLRVLPPWMRTCGRFLPLTRGLAVARHVAAGRPLAADAGLLLAEAAVGVAYLLAACLVLRLLDSARRPTVSFDAF
jgi:ABC-2 type transport system permease protein